MSIRPRHVYEDIEVGTRYLLFLKGGPWHSAPFITKGKGVFPIRNGEVKCHGGEVYGLTPRGVFCSRRHVQAAPPLDESALALMLDAALDRARQRRPELAAEHEATVQPLRLERGR